MKLFSAIAMLLFLAMPISSDAQQLTAPSEFVRAAEQTIVRLREAEADCRRIGIPILSECGEKFLAEIKRHQAQDLSSPTK